MKDKAIDKLKELEQYMLDEFVISETSWQQKTKFCVFILEQKGREAITDLINELHYIIQDIEERSDE
jgi:hypothetical protein